MTESIVTDKTIYSGKPDAMGRLPKEMASYGLLDSLGIAYRRLDHGPAMSVADCEVVEKLLGIEISKNLLLKNTRGELFMLMMPVGKRFDSSAVSRQVGSTRLSFTDALTMEQAVNITPGSLSVLGLLYDTAHRVRLLIDRDILRYEYFGCHPCVNTTSLKIKMDDLLGKFLPYTGHEPTIVEL